MFLRLAAATVSLCAAAERTETEVVRDGEHVRFALDEMCTAPLRGMFDGLSTVTVDWAGLGVVIDLSGGVGNDAAMPLVMVAANTWARQQRTKAAGRQRVNINDEAYYQYKRIETVEFAQERRKLGRQYGEANIDICHRPSDLASQTDRLAGCPGGLGLVGERLGVNVELDEFNDTVVSELRYDRERRYDRSHGYEKAVVGSASIGRAFTGYRHG